MILAFVLLPQEVCVLGNVCLGYAKGLQHTAILCPRETGVAVEPRQEGFSESTYPFPVPAQNYSSLHASHHGISWLKIAVSAECQSFSLYAFRFSPTQTFTSPSLSGSHTLQSHPHAHSSSHSGFFRLTHTQGLLHSPSRSFPTHSPPHTRDLAHSQSHSGSLTHARARAPASSSHHRPLRDPRSRRPPLSRGVPPAPAAPRGFRPPSSTRDADPQSVRPYARWPGPNRSQPLTSSAPPVTSSWPRAARMLGRAVAPAAQAPPTPRHSHRIATARAARGPGSERGPQAALLPGTRARRGRRRSAYRY